MPVSYKEVKLDCGYRIDILVEEEVVIELKTVEKLLPIHEAQLLTYLKMMDKRLGLLINFNVPVLRDGIKRIANRLEFSLRLCVSAVNYCNFMKIMENR